MNDIKQQLDKVESVGSVVDGKLVGEYDFYHYLTLFEGKDVKWSLELNTDNKL